MPLNPGTKLGPYEIQNEIGAGGMGEVYRARDTRLERTVAVKILPKHLSENLQLKQRFDREAKLISNLSHANICALFDVGSEDGVDFLVMEYLEGETLGDRLGKGGLPPQETVRLGMQIADALQAAHREGVVHRDLKPGNIMLTKSGVKLLDFGLAKAGETETGTAGLSALPTRATTGEPLTQEGSILGTFQYMAPEQLEGREADARSDIFALGAVLHEMATGAKAFEGDSQASLIAAIMSSEPRPISELQPMSPPAFEQLVKACLTKDPDERVQTAHDVRLQLQWIAEGSSAAGIPAPVSAKRRVRSRLAWALAGVFFLASALLAKELVELRGTPTQVVRATLLPPLQGAFDLEISNHAVSPDGTRIASVAADSLGQDYLWLRSLSSLQAEKLAGTENATLPFWSPDGRYVGFFVETKLKKVSVVGERRVQIVCDATSGRGGTWNEDGTILFCPASAGPLYRVPASGGTPTQVTSIDTTIAETAHRFPQFLPDGEHFVYVSIPAGPDGNRMQMASLGDPTPKTILLSEGSAVYAHPGHLLFEREGSLLAQEFDVGQGKVLGEPIPLPEDPQGMRGFNGSPAVSVSRNQVLVFPQTGQHDMQIEWFDREGKSIGLVPVPTGNYGAPHLSPSGDRLSVDVGAFAESEVWVIELNRGLASRLTFEGQGNSASAWSPDGQRIYFGSFRDGSRSIYSKLANGAGSEDLFIRLPGVFNSPRVWSPDGKHLVLRVLQEETGEDLVLVSAGKEPELIRYLDTGFNEMHGSVSPDGKWMAYRSDESGELELYVQSFPTPTAKYRISPNGAGPTYFAAHGVIHWKPDGSEIIYVAKDGDTILSTAIQLGETIDVGETTVLFKLPNGHGGYTTIDGERFLACVPSQESVTPNLTVVTNWMEGLTAP
jgi:serine/threonine protein kinase